MIKQEYIKYLKQLKITINGLFIHEVISTETQEIIQCLIECLDGFIQNTPLHNENNYYSYLKIIYTHLESIKHFIQLTIGNASNHQSLHQKLEEIINEIKSKLPATNLNSNFEIEQIENKNTLIAKNEDDINKEKRLPTEQSALYQLKDRSNVALFRRHLLLNTWKYALTQNVVPTKKIFISYAWPIENNHEEKWTKKFIENLSIDLSYAGILVYLDEYESGAGFSLPKHMGRIQESVHVLFISSRTMEYKLTLPESGVKYEYEQINKQLKLNPDLINQRYIIPVLLNGKNYCPYEFKHLAEVSFYKDKYIEGIKSLIKHIYGFGHLTFSSQWEKTLKEMKAKSAISPPFHLPCKNQDFTGRNKQLNELFSRFHINSSKTCSIQVITGIQGSGKTQLAIEYAQQSKNNFDTISYTHIIWLRGNVDLRLQFKELIKFLNIDSNNNENIATTIFSELKNCRVLLIFDNVENEDNIRAYLPSIEDGKPVFDVLITSFHQHAWSDYSVTQLPQEGFTGHEAATFIQKHINEDNDKITELVNLLGHFPLALSQAVAYIQKTQISIKTYVSAYQENKRVFLSHYGKMRDQYQSNVLNTWLTTLNKIKEQNNGAEELLYFSAFLSPDSPIPAKILKELSSNIDESEISITILTDYSLLSFSDEAEDFLQIHRLTQEVTFIHMQPEQREKALSTLLLHFKKFTEECINKSDTAIQVFLQNYDHICCIIKWAKQYTLNDADKNNYFYILKNIGEFQHASLAEYKASARILEEALLMGQNILPQDAPEMDLIRSTLTNSYFGESNMSAYLWSVIRNRLENTDPIAVALALLGQPFLARCVLSAQLQRNDLHADMRIGSTGLVALTYAMQNDFKSAILYFRSCWAQVLAVESITHQKFDLHYTMQALFALAVVENVLENFIESKKYTLEAWNRAHIAQHENGKTYISRLLGALGYCIYFSVIRPEFEGTLYELMANLYELMHDLENANTYYKLAIKYDPTHTKRPVQREIHCHLEYARFQLKHSSELAHSQLRLTKTLFYSYSSEQRVYYSALDKSILPQSLSDIFKKDDDVISCHSEIFLDYLIILHLLSSSNIQTNIVQFKIDLLIQRINDTITPDYTDISDHIQNDLQQIRLRFK